MSRDEVKKIFEGVIFFYQKTFTDWSNLHT